MEITQDACTQLLHDQFVYNFSQADDLSQLTRDARGEYKSQCLEYTSYTEIENMVDNWMNTEEEQKRPQQIEIQQPEKTEKSS